MPAPLPVEPPALLAQSPIEVALLHTDRRCRVPDRFGCARTASWRL